MKNPHAKEALLAIVCLAGCAAAEDLPTGEPPDELPPAADPAAQIDGYVRTLGTLPETPSSIQESDPSDEFPDGDYSCVTQDFQETRQYDKIVAFAANSESLWPGALIQGDAVYSGLFTQIGLPRAPMSFSVSLENLDGGRSATMSAPALSQYRDRLGEILDAEITGATAANIFAEIEEVYSRDQLAIALGASVGWLTGSVAASFDFAKTRVKSRYVVKYAQAYYTVDVDAPASPSAVFAPGTELADVQELVRPGSPPLYVSSITYGRMILFTFESEYSADEVGAALDFVYRGGVDVSGSVSVTYEEVLSKSNITAYILGGSGAQAAQAIDSYEALIDFIHQGGDYTRESPGAPIAYKLAYLADNSPARLSFTDAYTVTSCERVSQRVLVRLKSIHVDSAGGDAGDDLELYGKITAVGADEQVLFERGSGDYVGIDQGQFFNAGSYIGEAILAVTPTQGSTIRLSAHLRDTDGGTIFNPDDQIGNEVVVAPFETGWRREVSMFLSGDDALVRVVFELTPI
jgi:thiol-activated cytolysin